MKIFKAIGKAVEFYRNENIVGSTKRRSGWRTSSYPERDLDDLDRDISIAKARQKVEESPLACSIIQAYVDNVVGHGFKLHMTTDDVEWNQTVEAVWRERSKSIDIRGARDFAGLMRMWMTREIIDGDVGIILAGDDSGSYLQTIEADRITRLSQNQSGIDVDSFGRPSRYWIATRNETGILENPVAYSPRDFIFMKRDITERAERRRGVSAFLQVLNLLEDYQQIMEGIVLKVKNEAFMGLKFTRNPTPNDNYFGALETTKEDENGITRKFVRLDRGINLNLEEGEDVEVLESRSPHAEFDAFEKKLVSRIAFPLGMTYELVTGDYSQVNFSSARAMLEQFKRRARVEQSKARAVASRIFQWWVSRESKRFGLKRPEGEQNWWRHSWGVPGFAYIDPLKEANANRINLALGLTTLSAILSETGGDDFEDIMIHRKYEQEFIREQGVEIGQQQTAEPVPEKDQQQEGELE